MKLLYSSLFLLFTTLSWSQLDFEVKDIDNANASIIDGSFINKTTTAMGLEHSHHFSVKNISANTITISVRKYEEVLNAGAATYYCFDGACFLPGTTNATIVVASLGSFSLIPKLDEGAAVGYSQIRYKVSANTSSASISVTMKYNPPASVKENLVAFSSASNVYPNPGNSKSYLDVVSSGDVNNVTVKIYNSLGAVVSNKNVSFTKGKNTLELDTENFESGIYFATVSHGKNQLTKKIIISK